MVLRPVSNHPSLLLVCEHPDKPLHAYLLSGVNTILLPFKKTNPKIATQ